MRVIMTGGGTGGHIYPAIAIADKIKENNPEAEILFVGTKRGLEKDLVPQNGYKIRFITVSGFNRKQLLKNVKVVKDLLKGSREAKKIIREFKPDVVIGTGGYVCGPVVRAAHKLGVKTFIHEQNAFPGMTNKMLEKYVDQVFISFADAEKYFKDKGKLVLSGNPVRQSFFQAVKSDSRKIIGEPEDRFVILCFGGSQGAGKINSVMAEVAESLSGVQDVSLYFVTGKGYYDQMTHLMKEKGIPEEDNIHLKKYISNMQDYISAADLVVSRAGALAVSEITVCGRASVLIPSPNVTGNHQYYNAKSVADKGGAILLEEKDLNSEALMKIISQFKTDPQKRRDMELASRTAAPNEATQIIYEHLGMG
ncbi:undecaprenyldiphospho-muramoylpentapeptide beta-N-acetylglucosaminyltransferase [Aminipila butyrica]|uniref:UDP-N-acetylglucosamine--N-acetylmuramyl-(pentapeptide) pyrophosphoryl-undecaprenol N-acetylglucosamine transferase n=1 Tax=Aminipila butyrica TaxID=433296 RepID=A0A858BZD5_9FIRM|nr:undecaprenyldiphospho-muramoylpentapeptide beta-N-acetylglucosaminyltransferase [Aminipila butyrica]QIB70094.1 undecaprenyldiphospho-muramoylpentapeptide beta-N-acetylglucosaminyltransferase [Aminipila butyrica]